MSAVAVDTHSLFWYLSGSEKLSHAAGVAIDAAISEAEPIFVPSIILVEFRYLVEKGRTFVESDFRLVVDELSDPASPLTLAPLDLKTAEAVGTISRDIVADMPDRLIAATALSLGVPLISKDRAIARLRNVEVIC